VEEEVERMLADDLDVIESWISKLIAEETFTDHTGHVRTLQTMKIPFIEPGLNETAVLGVAIDITEQKHAKEEVARMRLYLKNIIDSMPSILIGVDPWGYITVLNQPAEQVVAYRGKRRRAGFSARCSHNWKASSSRYGRRSARPPIKTPADDAGSRRRTALRRCHGLSSDGG
jgi:PAS domain-containing protein